VSAKPVLGFVMNLHSIKKLFSLHSAITEARRNCSELQFLLLQPKHFILGYSSSHRLCGLVVRDPSYKSRGPGSIHGATRFSEK
jgi:hypothetical protein